MTERRGRLLQRLDGEHRLRWTIATRDHRYEI